VLDGIQVGGIGWQELQHMPGILDGLADVRPLVEGGVVHDDRAAGGQLGQQILGGPGMEHIRVDGALEQRHRE